MIEFKRKTKKYAGALLAVALAALCAVVLTGCSVFDFLFGGAYVEFTRSSLTLQIGDRYDLDSIVESETTKYGLASSDENIVALSGHTAVAKAVGVAYVTAETSLYSDRIKVTVTDVKRDGLTVEADGELIQTMGNTSEITFIPIAEGSIANGDIAWSVNGEQYDILPPDKAFTFMPTAAGVYEIKAASGEFTAVSAVRCYYETDASVSASGEFVQNSEPFTHIEFSVGVKSVESNPDAYIEWYEDERLLYSGTDVSYTYIPTPGRHTVRANVNGKRVYSKDGYFKGSVIPARPDIVYDNMFPHVYVSFDAVGDAQVEIASGETGEKTVCSSRDSRYAPLFTEQGFDAARFINLCASSNTRRRYTVRVKSLGDGDVYTESDYSESVVFTQLPAAAKKYIENVRLDFDHYVTSENEYTAVAEYYIAYRKKTGSESKVAFECYIAYDMIGDEHDLWNDAFPVAATSGEYRGISVSMSGRVLKTSFTVNTINTPDRQAPASLGGGYAEQLHAILPHINCDENKYRAEDHVFPIDAAEREASVTYTDELYLAVQRGVKPVPAVGSPAYTVYELARDVLRKICTDDMTDEEKAHAIYDWIMWHVTYDNPATMSSHGEMYSAYYLEGVFANGVTPIDGVVYKPYAVCDGISKAYSLLCNMEGIPCVRVVGTAGDTVSDAGGHAWNKVFVNGEWYGVDCTWGDATASLDLNGFRRNTYELGMHDYLFVTQSELSQNHYEPHEAGTSSIEYAPAATEKRLNVYKSMKIHGTTINCYVGPNENETERTREIARGFAQAYKNINKIAVPGERNGISGVDYQAVEIYYESGAPVDSSVKTLISNEIRAVHRNAEVRVLTYDNILLVLMRT